jgi:hypothetical protein
VAVHDGRALVDVHGRVELRREAADMTLALPVPAATAYGAAHANSRGAGRQGWVALGNSRPATAATRCLGTFLVGPRTIIEHGI